MKANGNGAGVMAGINQWRRRSWLAKYRGVGNSKRQLMKM